MRAVRRAINSVFGLVNLRIVSTTEIEDEITDLEFYRQIYKLRLREDIEEFDALSGTYFSGKDE